MTVVQRLEVVALDYGQEHLRWKPVETELMVQELNAWKELVYLWIVWACWED